MMKQGGKTIQNGVEKYCFSPLSVQFLTSAPDSEGTFDLPVSASMLIQSLRRDCCTDFFPTLFSTPFTEDSFFEGVGGMGCV